MATDTFFSAQAAETSGFEFKMFQDYIPNDIWSDSCHCVAMPAESEAVILTWTNRKPKTTQPCQPSTDTKFGMVEIGTRGVCHHLGLWAWTLPIPFPSKGQFLLWLFNGFNHSTQNISAQSGGLQLKINELRCKMCNVTELWHALSNEWGKIVSYSEINFWPNRTEPKRNLWLDLPVIRGIREFIPVL